jgi:peptide/nickel transport system ATP-binding protein
MVPSPTDMPAGCAFAPRCSFAVERCRREVPPLFLPEGEDHQAACFEVERVLASALPVAVEPMADARVSSMGEPA